jgi:hypothetical protein
MSHPAGTGWAAKCGRFDKLGHVSEYVGPFNFYPPPFLIALPLVGPPLLCCSLSAAPHSSHPLPYASPPHSLAGL